MNGNDRSKREGTDDPSLSRRNHIDRKRRGGDRKVSQHQASDQAGPRHRRGIPKKASVVPTFVCTYSSNLHLRTLI